MDILSHSGLLPYPIYNKETVCVDVCVCVCVRLCVCAYACTQPVVEEFVRRAVAHSKAVGDATNKKRVKSYGSKYLFGSA